MALVIQFVCDLTNGVHARPASHIETLCNHYAAAVEWHNLRTDRRGNAKSALDLIGTGTLKGDACRLTITGRDQQAAFDRLTRFLRDEFPHCDTPLPAMASNELNALPESLSRLSPTYFRGTPVCQGSAAGVLTYLTSPDLHDLGELPPPASIAKEQQRLEQGLALLLKHIELRLLDDDGTAGAILEAHRSLATDSVLRQHLLGGLLQGKGCAAAIVSTADHFCAQFANADSGYLQERVLDVRDVCFQLLQHIYGEQRFPAPGALQQPAVCMADELTPTQFLALDKTRLQGLLLRSGGTTSHTVILARSFNIPTLVGVDLGALQPWQHQRVQIDGNAGAVVVDLTQAVQRYYQQEARVQAELQQRQQAWLHQPGRTADGIELEVAANIAHSVEAEAAFNAGAEAIGLFRTEMLYMDRASAPAEDELYNIYCHALNAANGRSIIVRTMDIGGDKPVEYLNIPAENNPFLGYRAVRIYQEYLPLFRTQLRSLLRASAHGSLKIMIPMISAMEEILWVKEQLAEVMQALRNEHIPFDERIPLGIMLEVPSVMFIIDQCCEEIDFFSIGSNDLTQYLLAADRDNAKVTRHYNSLNPAFLRALNYAVQAAHRQGKWIGLCGELAAKGSVLPLLVGLGVDEISMSAPAILPTKARLAQLDGRACRRLLDQAMACRTSLEVEHLLATFRLQQQDAPLISTQCITLDSDWRSKEETIKAMTDNLMLAGRCRYPQQLAADLWAREAVFSTGLGFGFAIPHSKSEHIEQSTISVARLAAPVRWGDDDARFIIMLTLNKHAAGDQHMRIFSRLARRIMHEEFRQALIDADSSEAIVTLLERELEL
ncbi:phosphoenolpyruvate--protein phosphotransferase [Serratia entomophila]|uniref:phosphoenolpyruvate--protein phosphotransferase n=1 Tax=Serratia entomophila TaxID=42906 RepID=UPI00217A763D|nr:phosphoenolpyruvate--protein phosphotransferase [Serratia entomophila]CAI1073340.1 Multiphosphoryl transfer protein 1 [Serratia entomophila]CAI1737427.1 Multiphosphoryl transfer protein 1 [Serratia entomophila]CAI1758451.1 Multiphosphoryl transfer protein 1 [Serratia entomophila]CAI1813370.1 Multiphosphoryl transfer protein 1 [Serratia entomophila]CAI1858341.1 Multiphosphoryl transfer protein 1 [Serratia entomophila]